MPTGPSDGSRPRTNPSFGRALREAERYRALGYNPLPSKMDVKGPKLNSFAEFWRAPLGDDVFRDWDTTNIQIMCGTFWKLAVVDCDGDDSIRVWGEMRAHFGEPEPTWVARTGGGGEHWYFALPAWLDECPSRRLWGVWDTWLGPKHKGDWLKHQEVRLLADKALVIAPPSIHVKTGVAYRWLDGSGPDHRPLPAPAPTWLLKRPAIVNPDMIEKLPAPQFCDPARRPTSPPGAFHTREAVIAAIPDKVALARSWGLKIASRGANANGWFQCHSIDRDDANPSASFHGEAGIYSEPHAGTTLSLFDLAARLGAFRNWEEAKVALGDRYIGRDRP